MLSQAFDRFQPHIGQFVVIGLVTALAGFLIPFLLLMVFGGAGLVMAVVAGGGMGDPFAALAGGGTLFFLGVLLAVVSSLLLIPFTYGMPLTAARAVLAGEEVSLGRSFEEAKQRYGSILGYVLLTSLVSFVLVIIPLLGWIALIPVLPAFGYGFYALAAENLGAGAAFGRAWQGLGRTLGEHFLAGLVMIGLTFVVTLVFVILGLIPLVGQIAAMVLNMLLTGFFLVYLGLRYETNVRPYLNEHGSAPPPQYPQGPTV